MWSWLIPLVCAVLLALVGVVGDFFVKLAGKEESFDLKWLVLGALIYATTAIGWFFVMKHMKLVSLGVIYALSTILFFNVG